MSFKNDLHIFVGGKSGVFKGVRIEEKGCITKNLRSLASIKEKEEITTMCWKNDEKDIVLAYGSDEIRSVTTYSTENLAFKNTFACNVGKGRINGISHYNDSILTATQSGQVVLWKNEKNYQLVLNAGNDLHVMRHSNESRNVIATGGRENRLKLFDLQTQKEICSEKNLPHDFLSLRIPIWISDIGFLPGIHRVATVGRYGHIRLYDFNAQRRPVVNMEIKEEAFTTLAMTSKEIEILVGSGAGKMRLIDLRKPGKVLHTYKGFVGGITGLACSKIKRYVVSSSMDRHLRVHDIDTPKMVKKVYLTSRLTCLLLRSTFSMNNQTDNIENAEECDGMNNNNEDENSDTNSILNNVEEDTEYNALFDKMEVIDSDRSEVDSKRKRKKLVKNIMTKESSETHIRNKKKKRMKSEM